MIEINNCEVCGNDHLTSVINLGLHPMCDDLVEMGSDRVCKEFPIEIIYCENCNTAHQRFQVPKQELFPSNYHYRSRFTADVLNGMSELVESCSVFLEYLSEKKVLDIGCNDGSLLDFFKAKGAITFGIEPTSAYKDSALKGHITYNKFLSEDLAETFVNEHGKPDVITFTNVFAHIENLNEVLNSLKKLSSSNTIIIVENHYLGAVLEGNQFDTFYHEHPRTYSFTSFEFMANSLNMSILGLEFPSRYGGNIRIIMGDEKHFNKKINANIDKLKQIENQFIEKFSILNTNIDNWRITKKRLINDYVEKYGKIPAKAFPGRAAILIKLLGLNEDHISAVYEKPGSLKIGHYLPGTRIPINSDEDLFSLHDQSKPLLNLAWHIPNEIRNYLLVNEYTGLVFDVLSIHDFQQGKF